MPCCHDVPISSYLPPCSISVLKWNSQVPPGTEVLISFMHAYTHTYTHVHSASLLTHPEIFSRYTPSFAKPQLILPPFNTAPANTLTAAGVVADNSQWALPAPRGSELMFYWHVPLFCISWIWIFHLERSLLLPGHLNSELIGVGFFLITLRVSFW